MAPGSLLQTLGQVSHIPLLFCCQRFGVNSLQFHSSIEEVLMESGVCPVKRWGLFNCPQTSLYLLCKNYYGVTIFKAYFSIHKKKDIYFQSNGWCLPSCSLILSVCLNFFSPQFFPTPTSWYFGSLSCSGPFICTLEFFSCKFVQWKILFSLDRKHEELNKKIDEIQIEEIYFCVKLFKKLCII